MNEEQARALIRQAGASMSDDALTQALTALGAADRKHGTFRTNLANAHWRPRGDSANATWRATLITHSTEVHADFDAEEKAIVWLANRLGAIMWAHQYATRDHAEVVLPLKG